MNSSLQKRLQRIGPGLITAALVFGPGSLTVTTKLGANYAFDLLWVIVLAVVLMISYTQMSSRIGLATSESLLAVIRNRFGQMAAGLLGFGIFAISTSFQAGNAVGAGIAFADLFQMPSVPWIIFFSLGAISLLFFKSFYKILEKIMIGMVLIMFLSFFLTLVLSQPNLAKVISGLAMPSVPSGSEVLAIALVASSFSVVAAFYQSYLVKEKGWTKNELSVAISESRNGIIILGVLSAMIMICAAAVLHQADIPVNSASDLGKALEPLFGSMATYAFLLGFFAASFSSLIGNATIGGALLADAFSQGKDLQQWSVRRFIIAVIIIGAAVAIYFGALPLELIIFAQAFTIIIAPLAALFILLIANDAAVMGDLVNSRMQNILALIGLLLLLFLAGRNVLTIFN